MNNLTESILTKDDGDVNNKTEDVQFCSGNGQWWSPKNERDPQDYLGITFDEISAMAENPRSVAKGDAPWVITSTLKSRIAKEQREHGTFWALPLDYDDGSLTFDETVSRAGDVLGSDFIAYSSRSATIEKQKTHMVFPLKDPLPGEEYTIILKVMNDILEAKGVIPDRKMETPNQIFYLPNKGDFYQHYSIDFIGPLDPYETWPDEIQAEKDRLKAAQKALEEEQEESCIKAAQRVAAGTHSPVEAYNAAYELPMVLELFSYPKHGDRWLSPNSESGKPGVTISDDGMKWFSAHGSDAGIGKKIDTGAMGDAFDLFVHYAHGGDYKAALKAAGEMFMVDGVTITKANQREHMPNQNGVNVDDFDFNDEHPLSEFCLNGDSKKNEKTNASRQTHHRKNGYSRAVDNLFLKTKCRQNPNHYLVVNRSD